MTNHITRTSLLLPLSLGLLLTGCGRTKTDSNKIASNDQSASDKSTYVDPAPIAHKEAVDQPAAFAVAPPAASVSSEAAAREALKLSAATTPMVAGPAPVAATESTAFPTPATPVAYVSEPATPEPDRLAVTPATDLSTATDTPSTTEKSENPAKPSRAARLVEWKLTSADIKGEFEATGRIVRSKSSGADEPTGPMDEMLVALVKGELLGEPGLAALPIDVSVDKGIVTLTGTAKSLDQIGTAVAIALDTDGVTQAISTIKIEASN